MNLICDTTNSIGKLSGVRDDLVSNVVAAIIFNRPAIVDCAVLDDSLERKTSRVTVDVFIAYVF